jgi:predicted amidohydrolase
MVPPLLLLSCARAADPAAATSTGEHTGSTTDSTASSTGLVDPSETELSSPASSSSSAAEDGSSSAAESSSTGEPELPPAIGLVQYDGDAHFGEPEVNLAALTDWAKQSVEQGAKIIVLPEGSTYGYASPTELWCAPGIDSFQGRSCRDVSTVAETLPGGSTTDHWAAFATEHDVTVVYHVPERDGALYYASLGVVDATGFVARYRKRALYYVDAAYATPGDESVIIETPYGRFGLLICLDGTYDGPYYDAYVDAGVDGIIIAMDWDDDPDGPAAAIGWFRERADVNDVRIYGADVSTWDGTGLYLPGDVPRERNGLPPIAVGVDGISVHALP